MSTSETQAAATADQITQLDADPVFALHRGGKLNIDSSVAIQGPEELAMAYTPGVAKVCTAIAESTDLVNVYTGRGNTVAVVSDGTAVLGLGDIGPEAAMPVMEGKAMLFKQFGGVNAVPICLSETDTDALIDTIARMAPTFGGINLEDISAPRCFEIERRLQERLDLPVFHDDQHGTAIVVLAGLTNALRVVGKDMTSLRIVISGAGAAGVAIAAILADAGAPDVIVCDSRGIIDASRSDLTHVKADLAAKTNPRQLSGTIADAMNGADVLIGVSGGTIAEEHVATMSADAIVFALANPTPEVHPEVAARHAAVVATGRSDYPNQVNNVLAFPGIFRGALDCRASRITEGMKQAAAAAIAACIPEPTAELVIPSVFHPGVADKVAEAVMAAARAERVARA